MASDGTGVSAARPTDRDDASREAPARPHFPCFEGLRALAATMVVVHHAVTTAGPDHAGWVFAPAAVMDSGVAVFFVISGFLIYRPFVVSHLDDRPGPAAGPFLWRRAVRIVPAYWVVLTVLWAVGSFDLGRHWWRYYLFLQVYWPDTALGGVLQAWSLCTELTFYLTIPLWALLVRRLVASRGPHWRPWAELAGVATLFVAAFVSRAVISAANPSWRGLSFDWLPTNLDLFATGMAIAVISAWAGREPRVRSVAERAVRWPVLWAGGAVGLFAWYAWAVGPPDDFQYRGWFWQRRELVLAVMSAALLIPAVFGDQDRGGVRRVLRLRPIAWVGLVSYGLYLVHFDLIKRGVDRGNSASPTGGWRGWFHAAPFDAPVLPLLAVGLGLGLLAAAVSFYGIERPLQRRFRGRVAPAPTAAAAASD